MVTVLRRCRFVAAFVNDDGGADARSRVYVLDRSARGQFQPLITDVAAGFHGAFGGHTLFLRTTWDAPNRRELAIRLGKQADFTVLSADILKIPESEIPKTACRMTIIGGEVVYRAP